MKLNLMTSSQSVQSVPQMPRHFESPSISLQQAIQEIAATADGSQTTSETSGRTWAQVVLNSSKALATPLPSEYTDPVKESAQDKDDHIKEGEQEEEDLETRADSNAGDTEESIGGDSETDAPSPKYKLNPCSPAFIPGAVWSAPSLNHPQRMPRARRADDRQRLRSGAALFVPNRQTTAHPVATLGPVIRPPPGLHTPVIRPPPGLQTPTNP